LEIFYQNARKTECDICFEEEKTKKWCHYEICIECFKHMMVSSDYKFNCCTCKSEKELKFLSKELKAEMATIDDLLKLLEHINCQLCECGQLLINDNCYSMITCNMCKRTFCFFCNKSWYSETMRSKKYSCGINCNYEDLLKFELVNLAYGNIKVPNRRFCPKCFKPGAYDEKCKYHKCVYCSHSFCFYCLREETVCKKTSSYNTKCSIDLVIQTCSNFPHI